MSRQQWGHGFHRGEAEGLANGMAFGENFGQHQLAQQMRVLFCALVQAHKNGDSLAFWSTVEITKTVLSQHAHFTDDQWAVFRRDGLAAGRHAEEAEAPKP